MPDIEASHLPLSPGSEGNAVVDLSSRLVTLGLIDRARRVFDTELGGAVTTFQRSRRLHANGECDQTTWASLVEAGFKLGDRLLYRTSPMMRGDDVAELQLRLGGLGFDAGRVDGIFGPATEDAVTDFQQNVGLIADQVCGPETVAMLDRLKQRAGSTTVAGVRERRTLRHRPVDLNGSRIALVHRGNAEQLLGMLATDLIGNGADIAMLAGEDWSQLAAEVNAFDADTCIAVELVESSACEAAYFETTGFVSTGGRLLASSILAELPTTPLLPMGTLEGMTLPILRETRPPTAALRLGPAGDVTDQCALVASAVGRAILRWSESICSVDLSASTLQVK